MIEQGKKAPAFRLPSDSGETVSLGDFKGKKVVLYFYPKDMTPGCTIQACDFRDSMPKLKRKNAVVLGISRDSVARHQKFKEKYELPFPLLSDEDGTVCEAYGVWQKKKFMGRSFMGIVRTTIVINEKGKIEKIFPEVRVKGHSEAILEAL